MAKKEILPVVFNFIESELLNSSSSSEDEVNLILTERRKRRRVKCFITDVIHHYSDEEFKSNLRVTWDTANHICSLYERSNAYKKRAYKGGRKQKCVEEHVFSFLWFCSNKSSMREIASIFDMTESTFNNIYQNMLLFLTEEIAPSIIKFPADEDSKKQIASEFQNISGFPNVLGCIDGCYIPIRTPKHKIKSTYTNRHDMISITLQGICDSKHRFLDVYTGVPSKIHDSRIFKLSFISKTIPSLCGSTYHILGDGAYPIREYLLTPYKDYGNLTQLEKKFNKMHSQTRVKIENTFGILKARFRQILRLDFHTVEVMAKFILACCTLHNLCIDRDDLWIENSIDRGSESVEINDEHDNRHEALLKQLGALKRETITQNITT